MFRRALSVATLYTAILPVQESEQQSKTIGRAELMATAQQVREMEQDVHRLNTHLTILLNYMRLQNSGECDDPELYFIPNGWGFHCRGRNTIPFTADYQGMPDSTR